MLVFLDKDAKSKVNTKIREGLKILSVTPYLVKLVWSAQPRLAITLFLSDAAMGFIPLLNLWAMKLLVDSASGLMNASAKFSDVPRMMAGNTSLTVGLLLLALVWLLSGLLRPLVSHCLDQLNDALTRDINLLILDKIHGAADISLLENPTFYDNLQKLQSEMAYKPVQMLLAFSQGAKIVISLSTLLVLLISLNSIVPLLLIALCMPKIVFELRKSYNIWKIFEGDAPELRRMRYYSSVLTNNQECKEVRLFGLHSFFRKKYSDSYAGFVKRRAGIRQRNLILSSILALIAAVGMVCSYTVCVVSVVAGRISLGSMAMYIGAISQMEEHLSDAAFLIAELYRHAIFIKMLRDFLEIPPTIPLVSKEVRQPLPDKFMHGIEFKNVSFKYPGSDRLVLDGMSFTIDAGSTVAIVGENGAGKSTIVRLLLRFYDPTEGQILLDGIDLRNVDPELWRKRMSVVFQDFCKFQMTLRENIGIGDTSKLTDDGAVKTAAERAGVSSIADKLDGNYDTLLGKMFEQDSPSTDLSGGEWQKIALARAFMRVAALSKELSEQSEKPAADLMILDEPTASLDVQAEHDVYNRFHELTEGKMALIISHRFSTVKAADKILVMEHGKLKEQGTHQDLIAMSSRYAELYNLQAERYR